MKIKTSLQIGARRKKLMQALPAITALAMGWITCVSIPTHAWAQVSILGPLPCSVSGNSFVRGDFNGDGYEDVAKGMSWQTVDGQEEAGLVTIWHGSALGLSDWNTPAISQNSPGVADEAEAGDHFGSYLTTGDFNGDGFSDLAVVSPTENYPEGSVHVFYGSSGGLKTVGSTRIGDACTAVAAGNFYGDVNPQTGMPVDCLVIGDGWESGHPGNLYGGGAEPPNGSGVVRIYRGSPNGIDGNSEPVWLSQHGQIDGKPEDGDHFGSSLAVADFNGDQFDDLAVGVPYEDSGRWGEWRWDSGAVNIIYGSPAGLTIAGNHIIDQDTAGVHGDNEAGDNFGYRLLAGDFNSDGYGDLAISSDENDGKGKVDVLFGTHHGLTGLGSQKWEEKNDAIPGEAAKYEHFGRYLAAGNFDGLPGDDLAISVLDNAFGSIAHVLYSGVSGPEASGVLFHFLIPDIEADASFRNLVAGDFNGDGVDDLASYIYDQPYDGPGDFVGAVQVIEGLAGYGLTIDGNYLVYGYGPGGNGLTVGVDPSPGTTLPDPNHDPNRVPVPNGSDINMPDPGVLDSLPDPSGGVTLPGSTTGTNLPSGGLQLPGSTSGGSTSSTTHSSTWQR